MRNSFPAFSHGVEALAARCKVLVHGDIGGWKGAFDVALTS